MQNTTFHVAFRDFVHELYNDHPVVPLHAPRIGPHEQALVQECLVSTMVSYVSPFVQRLEDLICSITGSPYAIATVSGTSALQVALLLSGVRVGDLVLTPTLTFVATANAIRHAGADPVFLDSELGGLGLCPLALDTFLRTQTYRSKDGSLCDKQSHRRIAACVPVHIFGKPCQVQSILELCNEFDIPMVEDSAESLGSRVGTRACGTWGRLGILSFNGNKIATTGGGGMILTANPILAKQARHLTTTAKIPHPYEFYHDETAFNYRMPGINAALGCAQLDQLDSIIENKRQTTSAYQSFFEKWDIPLLLEDSGSTSNYWLNAIQLQDLETRNEFLLQMQEWGIQCRPIWNLLHTLPMYRNSLKDATPNAEWLQARYVNIPSSVRPHP